MHISNVLIFLKNLYIFQASPAHYQGVRLYKHNQIPYVERLPIGPMYDLNGHTKIKKACLLECNKNRTKYTSGRWPTWRTIRLYNTFISIQYMFRANTCSSSGGQLYQYSIWYSHSLWVAVRCTGCLHHWLNSS